MNMLLQFLNNPSINNSIDDILIATEPFEEHLNRLADLFIRPVEAVLTAPTTKCIVAYKQLEFWEHTVTQGYMFPRPKNLEKLIIALRLQIN